MKIEEYEVLRVEAKICSFFSDRDIEAKIAPQMVWRHYTGPYTMDKSQAQYFNPETNVVLVSKCEYHIPKTRNPYYKSTVFITDMVNKKIGNHLSLRDYFIPIAESMCCNIEANYSKHSGKFNRIVITLAKK